MDNDEFYRYKITFISENIEGAEEDEVDDFMCSGQPTNQSMINYIKDKLPHIKNRVITILSYLKT